MIAVDSSVWIDHLNDVTTEQVRSLRLLVGRVPILVGDLVLCEYSRACVTMARRGGRRHCAALRFAAW